jgi:hypothetical protein
VYKRIPPYVLFFPDNISVAAGGWGKGLSVGGDGVRSSSSRSSSNDRGFRGAWSQGNVIGIVTGYGLDD